MIDRRILTAAAVLAALLVAAVTAIALWVVPDRRDDIWVDLARAAIQLVVIIGLGGVVNTVYRQGYAVAAGVVMFAFLLVAVSIQVVFLRRREVAL